MTESFYACMLQIAVPYKQCMGNALQRQLHDVRLFSSLSRRIDYVMAKALTNVQRNLFFTIYDGKVHWRRTFR